MTQEVKKRNSWKIVAIALLVIVVVMGAIIGTLWMGQTKQSESEYTRVKVFSDSMAHATLGGYDYTFLYKWSLHYLDPQKPIEIEVHGLSQTLPPTVGKTYDILGIRVDVSEVYDDYIILLVKPL